MLIVALVRWSHVACCIAKSWLFVRRQDFCCLTPGQLDIQGESLDQMARWRRSIPDNLSVPLTHSPLCILSPWVSNAAQVAISSGFLLTLSNYFLEACLVIRTIHLLPLMDSSSHHCLWTKSWWDTMHLLSFILCVFTRKPAPNSRSLLFVVLEIKSPFLKRWIQISSKTGLKSVST